MAWLKLLNIFVFTWGQRMKCTVLASWRWLPWMCVFAQPLWTRWYPRGIQKLVSPYDLPDSGPMGGYSGVRTENTQFSRGDHSGVRTNKHRWGFHCTWYNYILFFQQKLTIIVLSIAPKWHPLIFNSNSNFVLSSAVIGSSLETRLSV